MAYSSDVALSGAVRGFIPPQNEEEKLLMRRAQELCQQAQARSMPRYTGFLSDREQALCQAALHKAGCGFARFDGGYAQAERKILCIEPPDAWQEQALAFLCITVKDAQRRPTHRDYLGSILGLGLERACLGDLLLDAAQNRAFAVTQEDKADFICIELREAGNCPVQAQRCDALPAELCQQQPHELHQATVASLRADSVLAAMMHTSRTLASAAIAAGRVEINHVPLHSAHEPVYENDLFTVRGSGRYRLQGIGGKSKKDRIFIIFYQY